MHKLSKSECRIIGIQWGQKSKVRARKNEGANKPRGESARHRTRQGAKEPGANKPGGERARGRKSQRANKPGGESARGEQARHQYCTDVKRQETTMDDNNDDYLVQQEVTIVNPDLPTKLFC